VIRDVEYAFLEFLVYAYCLALLVVQEFQGWADHDECMS
jgi:hypothetical protein